MITARDRLQALGLIAAMLAAIGIGSALTAPPAHAAAVSRCHARHLHPVLYPSGATAGANVYRVGLENTSAAPCTLAGYPGLSLMSSPAGERIGRPAIRNPQYPFRVVTVRPGYQAWFLLSVSWWQNYPPARCGHPVAAGAVRVYAPGAWRPRFIVPSRPLWVCSRPRPGSELTVTTVQG